MSKRMKELELKGASKNTFFKSLYVKGFYVCVGNQNYITYAKKMADACENVYKITGETNIYENEVKYVKPADRKQGIQIKRPFWWYGRVYKI